MVCSRGPGKFCSPRMTRGKVLKMCSILDKVALALCFAGFLNFVDFDRSGAIRMICERFRPPWAAFRQVWQLVRRHHGCYWAARMSLCRHQDSGFPQAGLRQVRQSFEDKVCLGSCFILVRRPSAWSQSVPRSVSTCLPRGNLVDGLQRA